MINDNRQLGIDFLGRVIDVVRWAIRQFQVEKKQIEMLLVERGERFLHGADDDSAESDFFQENVKQTLPALIVIYNKHCRLAGLVFLEDVFVERRFFDAPAATDLDGGKLPALHEVIDGRQRNPQVLGRSLTVNKLCTGENQQLALPWASPFCWGKLYKF